MNAASGELTLTASSRERFWSHVIKGPAEDDCWIWVGAIADDGYGRSWTKAGGRQRVLRPQRVVYELITGRPLTEDVMPLHGCDVPLCVHATVDAATSHVREGTNRGTILDRFQGCVTASAVEPDPNKDQVA